MGKGVLKRALVLQRQGQIALDMLLRFHVRLEQLNEVVCLRSAVSLIVGWAIRAIIEVPPRSTLSYYNSQKCLEVLHCSPRRVCVSAKHDCVFARMLQEAYIVI